MTRMAKPRAVSDTATVVVDLACGSGPMSRELAKPGRTVVGLDLSEHELALAVTRSDGPWVQADALHLPFRDESVDVVTSSMGLVVVQPLMDVLDLGHSRYLVKPYELSELAAAIDAAG